MTKEILNLEELHNKPWNPAEQVASSQLRPGDIVTYYGCLMQVNEVKNNAARKAPAEKTCYWTVATVISEKNSTIPASWFGRDDHGNKTWQIQGNDRATWHRVHQA